MYFREITARNFRNYGACTVAFDPRVNCFAGANAQGKTNLIEALFCLAFGRSFRTSEYRYLIRWEEAAGRLAGVLQREEVSDDLVVELGPDRKRHLVNGKVNSGREKLVPAVVLFAPEEVLLFKEGPALRRDYIDQVAAIATPAFALPAERYARVVAQRNRLFKTMGPQALTEGLLAPWNRELIQWGTEVLVGRAATIAALNAHLPEAYRRMAGTDPVPRLVYVPCCGAEVLAEGTPAIQDWFQRTLAARAVEELQRQVTLVGPHRDDLTAELGGKAVHDYASQGQHRSVVLALKIAEGEIYRQRDREPPIFLLDDVTSELDPARTGAFFRYLAETASQVLWTTTGPAAIPTGSVDRTFVVEQGKIYTRPQAGK